MCPFAVHFAEAVGARIYALPHKQFLLEKAGIGHEFIDITGRYGALDLRTQLIRTRPAKPAPRRSLGRRLKKRLRALGREVGARRRRMI